ncbi:MAG: hypothetical protein RL060_1141 [Bacteroidota bacterium]|jgi:hypothetical protein
MASLIQKLRNPITLKLFFITKLPMALLAGLSVVAVNDHAASIAINYGYLTKNPFKSLYFACLAMAAELASGVLVLTAVDQSNKAVSTLVTAMEASFSKKGLGKVVFTCEDGEIIAKALQLSISSQQGVEVQTTSTGKDEQGDVVAVFTITWSLKVKKSSLST